MSDNVIQVENLSKKYVLRHQSAGRSRYVALRDVLAEKAASFFRRGRELQADEEEFWALRDVSFEVKRGESVGIIGRNGAGKSTLLKILSRITDPSSGRIEISGRVSSLLEVGTGFHPELTGRENIYLNGAILGMKRAEIKKKFDEIVAFAEVEKFLDTPVKHFSSGMYTRLAFAVAAHLESEILIVDEVLAVGDAEFQKKCMGKMRDVSDQEGRTVIFVSHNMDAIMRLCSRAILLQKGKIIPTASVKESINQYAATRYNQEAVISFAQNTFSENLRRNVVVSSVEWPEIGLNTQWTLPFGRPITFRISIKCRRVVKRFELGFGLFAASGTEIASTTSIMSQPDLTLDPGVYQFNVTYNSMKLVPGSYNFGIGLRSDSGLEDYIPQAFFIDIIPSQESSVVKADTFMGYIVPDVTYNLI